ncbi:MAG: response regulator [Hyphomicrobiaceae bacterium]
MQLWPGRTAPRAAPTVAPKPAPTSGTKTALVIDDDPLFQEVAAMLIGTTTGFNVVRASDGREGLRQVLAHADQLGLMVCDLNMPDCDGVEFFTELSNRGLRVPLLLVTAAPKPVARAALGLANASGLRVLGLLSKPVNVGEFSALVAGIAAGVQAA